MVRVKARTRGGPLVGIGAATLSGRPEPEAASKGFTTENTENHEACTEVLHADIPSVTTMRIWVPCRGLVAQVVPGPGSPCGSVVLRVLRGKALRCLPPGLAWLIRHFKPNGIAWNTVRAERLLCRRRNARSDPAADSTAV